MLTLLGRHDNACNRVLRLRSDAYMTLIKLSVISAPYCHRGQSVIAPHVYALDTGTDFLHSAIRFPAEPPRTFWSNELATANEKRVIGRR